MFLGVRAHERLLFLRHAGRRRLATLLAAILVLGAATGTASAQTPPKVNLRVLVISGGQQAASNATGGAPTSPILVGSWWRRCSNRCWCLTMFMMPPPETLIRNGAVSNTSGLTADLLAPGSTPTSWTLTGNYNGIILTDSQATGVSPAGSCTTVQELAANEWKTLDDYASNFAVRQSVISGWLWPWNRDYGMAPLSGPATTVAGDGSNQNWLAPAGGTDSFEYLKRTTLTLDALGEAGYTGTPRLVGSVPTATTPSVQPLLASGSGTSKTLISIVRYAANPQACPPADRA